MTEKLYYKDSHMRSFTVTVLECKQTEEAYEAVLDRTAFFPEGGGQCADIGTLGDARVLDVQEKDGVIYHTLDKALEVGAAYDAEIDWELRFSAMQQHSGEHIVSGIVHRLYGYQNIGFHMGKDAITMDFDGVLTKQQLREIEYLANEVVVRNAEITTLFPTKEELHTMSYRSKMEIPGQV
ncbi:MAG: alanyl-tRNA editing protein, partial [Faecalimonas sp.]|nr:alanyl-tRNA editing protein [Faecalimonas sp.]